MKPPAAISPSRLGAQVRGYHQILELVAERKSVACPRMGEVHPAAWILNMNYGQVCHRIETGLFVYVPTAKTKRGESKGEKRFR